MKTIKYQQGVTLTGFIGVMFVVVIVGYIGLKLVPIYAEYLSVKKAVTSLQETPNINRKSTSEIRNILAKKFTIDYVTNVTPEEIEIVRKGKQKMIKVNYSVQESFIANIDLLITFQFEETI